MTGSAARDEAFELLGIRSVQALTGLPERVTRDLLYNRRLPVVKIGKRVYVRRIDLAEWINANIKPARGGETR